MPSYLYRCACERELEEYRSIADRNSLPKCACGGKMERVFQAPNVKMDLDWSSENGGRGRFINQYAKRITHSNGDQGYDENDPKAYHRSQKSAVEEGNRRELKVTKA